MLRKKLCCFAVILFLLTVCLCLCGCDETDIPSSVLPSESQSVDVSNNLSDDLSGQANTPPVSGFEPSLGTDLDFGLGEPTAPSIGGDDLGEPGETGEGDDGMYIVIGNYAYALDAETLNPVGLALDPVTHEVADPQPEILASAPGSVNGDADAPGEEEGDPIPNEDESSDLQASEDSDSSGVNESSSGGSGSSVTSGNSPASSSQSTGNRLPNTGIFLEDD